MVVRELLGKVRRIEIRTRQAVDELFAGAYRSVFRGRGIEFDEVREYVAGDDVGAIDWQVTARLNAPYVRAVRGRARAERCLAGGPLRLG